MFLNALTIILNGMASDRPLGMIRHIFESHQFFELLYLTQPESYCMRMTTRFGRKSTVQIQTGKYVRINYES